ncbi:hypothetical protein BJF79_21855 [Actinomadura sp. CNU-125]|nr:hypothetical protein BJF79_21855 [Actinomadura sp. CNU-125]
MATTTTFRPVESQNVTSRMSTTTGSPASRTSRSVSSNRSLDTTSMSPLTRTRVQRSSRMRLMSKSMVTSTPLLNEVPRGPLR